MIFGLFKSLDEKVQEDTNRLISMLQSCDMPTLVTQMANHKPISDNIRKKQKRDKSLGSKDSPSWFAYKVSSELKDEKLKPQLIQLLNDPEFSDYKKYTLRSLGSLCSNTNDLELFDFIISHLKQEENEETITTVLNGLTKLRKPKTVNIEYLKNLVVNGTYQNRIDALRALNNCEHPDLEDLLLEEFKTSDQHTKGMICSPLRSVATKKSIDVLNAELKRTRDNVLISFIGGVLEEINKRENRSS